MMNETKKSMTLNDALRFADDLRWYAEDKRRSKYVRSLLNQSAEVITALVEGYKSYQRPTGHWELTEHTVSYIAKCSRCGEEYYYPKRGQYQIHTSLYCPNCGTYMRESENNDSNQRDALQEFAMFVAVEVCREDFEAEAGAFAESACRKLYKLGIIQNDGGMWRYEPEEEVT